MLNHKLRIHELEETVMSVDVDVEAIWAHAAQPARLTMPNQEVTRRLTEAVGVTGGPERAVRDPGDEAAAPPILVGTATVPEDGTTKPVLMTSPSGDASQHLGRDMRQTQRDIVALARRTEPFSDDELAKLFGGA